MEYPLVNIHTHLIDPDNISIRSISLVRPPFEVDSGCSAGIHPWDAEKADYKACISFLASANIVAIGEIGLDFAIDSSRTNQLKIFEEQLTVAAQRALPLIIHSVRANSETLRLLKLYNIKTAIYHSFIGSAQEAKEIVQAGYYISLSNRSLSSSKTVAAAKSISLNNLFLETDAADVSIGEIYDIAAEKLGIPHADLPKLTEKLYTNYKKIFQ